LEIFFFEKNSVVNFSNQTHIECTTESHAQETKTNIVLTLQGVSVSSTSLFSYEFPDVPPYNPTTTKSFKYSFEFPNLSYQWYQQNSELFNALFRFDLFNLFFIFRFFFFPSNY